MDSQTLTQLWLDALFDSRAAFTISLLNIAGRLRIPDGWASRVEELPEHLIYFAAEGAFDAEINGEKLRIQTGDLLWASIGSRIHFRLRPGERLVVWRFRLQAMAASGMPLPAIQPYWHLSPARPCEPWVGQIVDEVTYPGPHSVTLLRVLVAGLFTEIQRQLSTAQEDPGHLTRVQRATLHQFRADHPRQWLAPADLARAVELSPDYFTRCFRRTYGVPPRRWLVQERLRSAAMRLLETTANISEIARDLGYEDVFLFSRQFKAEYGVGPKAYREGHSEVSKF